MIEMVLVTALTIPPNAGFIDERVAEVSMPVSADCVPQPEFCYVKYSLIWFWWQEWQTLEWPFFMYDTAFRTGYDMGQVPPGACDVEHAFARYSFNPGPGDEDTWVHWEWDYVPGLEDFYISYADTASSTPYHVLLGPLFFKLSDVVYDDPDPSLPQPYNACWIVGMSLNADDPYWPPDPDLWLGCPRQDMTNHVAKFVIETPDGYGCPADFSGNGTVDADDFLFLLENWGSPFDVADFLHLLSRWGGCPYTVE